MFSSLRSTTEPSSKSRNIISELNSNNILRGINVYPANQDTSRSVSFDEGNTKANSSATPITNSEQILDQQSKNHISDVIQNTSTVPGSYSNEGNQTNFSDFEFRNTRDLSYKSTVANSTDMNSSSYSISNLNLSNHTLYTVDLDSTTPISIAKNETITTSATADNNATKELDKSTLTSKAFLFNITTPSSLMKNMKDRETKVKPEINSKPAKKLIANVKSKVPTQMENSTVKFKFENNTEQFINTSSNNSVTENITRNITVSRKYFLNLLFLFLLL